MAQTTTLNINLNSKQAQQNADNLSKSINKSAGSATNLRVELRQITKELQNLEPGSARFSELSARAGKLKDQIQDTNAVINATSGNVTENFGRALGNSIQIGIAGFQALSSVQALFGADNEELNKSIQQFTALLNLSQAVETFGGLGDKITEIKAGFQGLTTATSTQAVAQEGSNIATAQGTVATTALGVSMKALPIIALVAGLAALTYGIYKYATANDETAKQEEKLKKQREASAKARIKEQKESVSTIAKESSQFVSLVGRLKETNKNSEERKELIKNINKEYGTTLKNLSDEVKFQDQLNLVVKDYIKYQTNKHALMKNEEYVQYNLERQLQSESKLNKIRTDFNNKNKGLDKEVAKRSFDKRLDVKELTNEYNKSTKAIEDLTKRGLQLIETQDELTKGKTKKTKDNTDELNKNADVLERIKEQIERQILSQEELNNIQDETSSKKSTQLGEELKLIRDYNKFEEDLIKRATQREVDALDQKFKEGLIKESEYKESRIKVQKEGEKNLLEIEKTLLKNKKSLLDEDLDNVENKYELQEKITLNSITSIQDQSRLIELEYQKQNEIISINDAEISEEKKQQAILDIKKKYLDLEVGLIKQSGKSQIDTLELVKQQQLSNDELTSNQRLEIEAKYNQDVLKVNQDTQTKVQEAIDGTKQVQLTSTESLTKTINKISQYADKMAEILYNATDLISQANETRFNNEERRIDGLYNYEKQSLDDQLKEGIISREQYDDKVKELDQQQAQEELQLAREKFEEQKKLQIINATIQGAQAVLAAYTSGAAVPIIGAATTGPIYAAIAGAFAAAQIATISNQTFTAAQGGIVPGNGPGNIDSVPSLLAPGEFVINSQSAKMYPNLLSQINEQGGGKKLVPDLPPSNTQSVPTNVFQEQGTQQQTIKAYVVESEISDSQKRINRIKRSAEF